MYCGFCELSVNWVPHGLVLNWVDCVLTDCACYILSCVPLQVLLLNCIALYVLDLHLIHCMRMYVMPTPGGIPMGIPAGMTSGDVIFWQGGVVA